QTNHHGYGQQEAAEGDQGSLHCGLLRLLLLDGVLVGGSAEVGHQGVLALDPLGADADSRQLVLEVQQRVLGAVRLLVHYLPLALACISSMVAKTSRAYSTPRRPSKCQLWSASRRAFVRAIASSIVSLLLRYQ